VKPNQKREIIFILYGIGPGGAERVTVNLLNYWAAKSWDISLVTYDQKYEKDFYSLSDRVRRIRVDPSGHHLQIRPGDSKLAFIWKHVRLSMELRKIIKSLIANHHQPIIISFIAQTNLLTLLARFFLKVPIIVSERVYPSFCISRVEKCARSLLYPLASAVVIPSTKMANYFGRLIRRRTHVIANPIELGQNVALAGREKIILAVGRLDEQKRFDLLIQAFAKIATQFADWKVQIVGSGPCLQSLQQLSRELGIASRIHFVGNVHNIAEYYGRASVFILSSDFEGFPNALAEAMTHGCAVIASDCPSGPSDLIEQGISGYLFEPGNAQQLSDHLATFLLNPTLRDTLGVQARKATQAFSIDKISKAWEDLFDEIT
jgi:GalNAc-alpha-(1->4)-GalNAc-alpha-(1->3)-diNAcBac-PP-undecaprenol alpha-1,4-N-acetyl-D-galactosaminyltransferase